MRASWQEMMDFAEFKKEELIGVKNKLTKAEDDLLQMKSKINNLEDTKSVAVQKSAALQRFYNTSQDNINILNQKIESLTKIVYDKEKERVKYQGDNEELRRDVERQQREIVSLKNQLQNKQDEYDDKDIECTTKD